MPPRASTSRRSPADEGPDRLDDLLEAKSSRSCRTRAPRRNGDPHGRLRPIHSDFGRRASARRWAAKGAVEIRSPSAKPEFKPSRVRCRTKVQRGEGHPGDQQRGQPPAIQAGSIRVPRRVVQDPQDLQPSPDDEQHDGHHAGQHQGAAVDEPEGGPLVAQPVPRPSGAQEQHWSRPRRTGERPLRPPGGPSVVHPAD